MLIASESHDLSKIDASRIWIEFSDFSEFRESDKLLKDELSSCSLTSCGIFELF